MVFQNYALYPHMTVYNNMAFGLTLRKIPKDEIKRRVEEAARILDISHLLERKPKQLSGGQKQRVALGRAIVRNPKVFLLDEPLSNLDAKLRASMRTELTKLHQKVGTTFVYVTHDQVEAMTMATRIVVMKDGFIQQVDTPQNLYDLPVNKFVAGFIGTPQMNFISATLEKHGNSLYLVFGTHVVKLPENAVNTPALKEYIGQEVLLGIRPEDISDDAEKVAASPETSIECTIDVTELMGAEIYLYLGFDGQEDYVDEGKNIISRVSARSTSRAGDTLKVCFDVTRAHIFDKDTERCICHCAVDPNAVPAHGIIFEEDEVAEEEVATEEVVTEEVVEETTEE
jgi:multiple sugar transport system ATP-binding protein